MTQGSPNVFKTTQVISIAFSVPPLLHNKFCCRWSYTSVSGHKDQLKIKGKFVPDDYLLICCKLLRTIFDGVGWDKRYQKHWNLQTTSPICQARCMYSCSTGKTVMRWSTTLLHMRPASKKIKLCLELSTLLETSWLISIINILKGKTVIIDLMKCLALKLPPNIYFINMHLNFL